MGKVVFDVDKEKNKFLASFSSFLTFKIKEGVSPGAGVNTF